MIFSGFAQGMGQLLATDGALMVLSMLFGVLLGLAVVALVAFYGKLFRRKSV